jgi:hypothetical protein
MGQIKGGRHMEELYTPSYEELVVMAVRSRYDLDAELAILRKRDSKPEEFEEYNTFVE